MLMQHVCAIYIYMHKYIYIYIMYHAVPWSKDVCEIL